MCCSGASLALLGLGRARAPGARGPDFHERATLGSTEERGWERGAPSGMREPASPPVAPLSEKKGKAAEEKRQ